jgi:transcriptional regulator with XRE-family HTH domain
MSTTNSYKKGDVFMVNLKLKEFREAKNYSQRELADRLGITQAYYWKWESGKSFPNAKQIVLICKVLDCSPNEIFGFKGVYNLLGAKIDGEIK